MFKVGDIISRYAGGAPIKVTGLNQKLNVYYGKYVESGLNTNILMGQVVPYKDLTPDLLKEKDEDKMTNTLFQWTKEDKTFFGHHIATNNQGKYVMEIKGSGNVVLVDLVDLQEVTPYTIGVVFFGTNTAVYNYTAQPGLYKVGEVFVLKNHNGLSLVQIHSVDGKSKAATKEFTPLGKVTLEMQQ